MRRYYKVDGQNPTRLLSAVGLAFTVMLFINGFIGSMGGFPAFLAFAFVFFFLRSGRKDTDGHVYTKKQETAYLLWDYGIGYLILWGILRIAFLISRVTGWGNINGASAAQLLKQMWETSLLEKWAYFFAGMTMFAFILSLFPLLVIRERGRWARYALLDGAVFALACLAINGICRMLFEQDAKSRATCLIDHLLLCGDMQAWQEIVCLVGMAVLTAGVGIFVFFYAVALQKKEAQKTDALPKHPRIKRVVAVACSLAAIAVVVVIVLFMPQDADMDYVKVAEFLTEDVTMAPMVYGGTVYIPVAKDSKQKPGVPQGYLAERDERCDSRFYQMAVANLLYADTSGESRLVQTEDAAYEPAADIEQARAWEADEVFLLWDEEWEAESAYSHEPTGYAACPADLIAGLRMQFPDVTYRISDFSDYDAYFTLRGYRDMDQALEEGPQNGDWVGCILVRDNKFYFGSYENRITGICLQQLREVLGGNAK